MTKPRKEAEPKPLPWTAVRKGAIYCAPACGGECTFAAFKQATADAAKLAERLGPGWKPRVHENLGWHFSVVSADGFLKVSHPSGSYLALLGESGVGGRWAEHSQTPEEAIHKVRGRALSELGIVQKLARAGL